MITKKYINPIPFLAITLVAPLSIHGQLLTSKPPLIQQEDCRTRIETRQVRGNSMDPLLKDQRHVKIVYGYYSCHPVQKGDIAVINYGGSSIPLIKSIKGIPEDSFSLKPAKSHRGWNILVNGKILKNSRRAPYLISNQKSRLLALYESSYKGKIPENAYLVLGDHPEGSMDSTELGLIGRPSLAGKIDTNYRP